MRQKRSGQKKKVLATKNLNLIYFEGISFICWKGHSRRNLILLISFRSRLDWQSSEKKLLFTSYNFHLIFRHHKHHLFKI